MSTERRAFIPYETIDYVYTINLALQKVFEARAQLSDSITYERYLRVVEALYAILAPRLRSSRVKELIEKAKRRDPEGFYTSEGVEALDKAVELILDLSLIHI